MPFGAGQMDSKVTQLLWGVEEIYPKDSKSKWSAIARRYHPTFAEDESSAWAEWGIYPTFAKPSKTSPVSFGSSRIISSKGRRSGKFFLFQK
jgi:hypothetical protein